MAETASISSVPIAIIGMACRLPGANTLEDFWELLVSGKCAIGEVPPERLDRSIYHDARRGIPGKTYSTLAGIMSAGDDDASDSRLSPELRETVDSSHWRMCEVAAAACRHGRMDPFALADRNVGVFVGYDEGSGLVNELMFDAAIEEAAKLVYDLEEFQSLAPGEREHIQRQVCERVRLKSRGRRPGSLSLQSSMVAGIVAKALGLTGPYLALDSACSSSLQAMLLGVRALQRGRIDTAVVGGSSTIRFDTLLEFSKAGAKSSTGTRPFDANADGVVCSEGCVAIVLKALPRALADGDPIQAVIRGLGVSCDGRGKGIWAPSHEGQVQAIRRAYRSDVMPADIQYIEAHATSTQVGDAVELQSLLEVFKDCDPAANKIAISSVKANIGHTLEAAGLAGVVKTVLCMQHAYIAPAIGIAQPTKKIDWDATRLYLPLEGAQWPSNGKPRRAAVNAFGLGGLNMHVVLEDANERDTGRSARVPHAGHNGDEAVAIVGRGCVFPGAFDIPQLRELIAESRPSIEVASTNGATETSEATPGRFITGFEYDWRRHKIPPKQLQQADPLQFLLLEAVDQAIGEASVGQTTFDRSNVGVVVGCEFTGDFTWQWQLGLRLPEIERALRDELSSQGFDEQRIESAILSFAQALRKKLPTIGDDSGSFHHSTFASRIARTWDLMGGAQTIDSGCTSGLAAVATGIDLLIAGDCDMVVCCAGHRRPRLPSCEETLDSFAREQPSMPADGDHTYLSDASEGAAAVVLKRLTDARRDGDRIFGVIRGVEAARSDVPSQALRQAMSRALHVAAVSPGDVTAVESHAMHPGERNLEIVSQIADLLDVPERSAPAILGTAAGILGQTRAASGMAPLLKAVLQLENAESAGASGQANGERDTLHKREQTCAVLSLGDDLAYCAILESAEQATDPGRAAVGTSEREIHQVVKKRANQPVHSSPDIRQI